MFKKENAQIKQGLGGIIKKTLAAAFVAGLVYEAVSDKPAAGPAINAATGTICSMFAEKAACAQGGKNIHNAYDTFEQWILEVSEPGQ